MRFNGYIWDLYKQSEEGRNQINEWSSFGDFPDDKFAVENKESTIERLKKLNYDGYIHGSKVNWFKIIRDYFKNKEFAIDKALECYKSWIAEGVVIEDFAIVGKNNFISWTTDISFYSRILYSLFPDYFFPYTFKCEFFKFQNICNEFDIPIPAVPKKKDWEDRALFYVDLCESLFEFRKLTGFKPNELCAFLYDFAPSVLRNLEDNEVPNPSKVWFVGANKSNFDFLDNAKQDSSDSWQGNPDAKRGDIVVMYCLTPRSYIHSIWRVVGDGFSDPFFYYYNVVYLSHPIILDIHITQRDLEANPVWAANLLIKKNLQGLNGYPIKFEEYLELVQMLKSKAQNVDILPTIKPTSKLLSDDLKDERDVEIRLIEPLLELLDYNPKDWMRQMTVKMGRGERNYPDYCFGANQRSGGESVKMILESKYEIKTQRELQNAYFQAKSYALRLQADKFVIAAKEGIWIYKPVKNSYKFDNYFTCNWVDIENPDLLHNLKKLIGKNFL
ncbi:MAG: hypothetical protein IPN29_02935 [Saprospiraceae bacterium]|nr:hypothetical protein [Saprospiraceae bacterium]